jgi:signal transduction histidine kinase
VKLLKGLLLRITNEEQIYKNILKALRTNDKLNENEIFQFVQHYENLKERNSFLENEIMELSKKSSMGEMIDIIAHQWKQPLTIISLYNHMLVSDFEYGVVDKEYIDDLFYKTDNQVSHLITTLHEFRDFLRPNRKEAFFSVTEALSSVQLLLEDIIKGNQIELNILSFDDFMLFGSENDFKHVFINFINNSKDAFIDRDVDNRKIEIKIFKKEGKFIIEFLDNAGGIPERVLSTIFEPNISTKQTGTGMGLYMTKMFIDRLRGSISVSNYRGNESRGAKFSIEFNASFTEELL